MVEGMCKFNTLELELDSKRDPVLLVETIPTYPQEGDTFQEFTTHENYSPYKK